MKIIANRKKSITAADKDDILKRRDEYDSQINDLQKISDENTDKYRQAERQAASDLEKTISNIIGPTPLHLEIRVDSNWDLNNIGWWIRISANEYLRREEEEKTALRWSWDVKLDKNGEVRKDSSSWSGLQAVTPEQIEDLEESVRIIKILNSADWALLLRTPRPQYSDFSDEENFAKISQLKKDRPKFEDELLVADLDDIINNNKAIKLRKDEYYRGSVYILPTGYTDKFVKGYIFPEYFVTSYNKTLDEIKQSADERRTKKENLVVSDGHYDTIDLV